MHFGSVPGLGADQSPGRPLEDRTTQVTDLAKAGMATHSHQHWAPEPFGDDAKLSLSHRTIM